MASGLQKGLQINLKNCVVFIKTRALGSGALLFTALKFGEGNLTLDIAQGFDYRMNRGKLDDVRDGDDVPMSLSFSGKYTFMGSNYAGEGTGPEETYTIHELLSGKEYLATEDHGKPKFRGTRESWLADFGCPPYCVDIEIHNNPAMLCPDTEAIGEATLIRYFRAEALPADLSGGNINISGKAHITHPMVARCAGPAGTSPGTFPKFDYTSEADAVPFDDASEGGFWPADARAA